MKELFAIMGGVLAYWLWNFNSEALVIGVMFSTVLLTRYKQIND